MPFIFKVPLPVPIQVTFNGTGSIQQFNVPSNVNSISIKMWGAGGGGGRWDVSSRGGGGGFASGTLTVTPSSVLDIYVGMPGLSNAAGGAGGWPGGGKGGDGSTISDGGGGGGLSAIFPNGNFTTPFIVAGAGGGGGTDNSYPGGGLQNWYSPGVTEGQLGSQTAGGAGGQAGATQVSAGSPGSFFAGGDGGTGGVVHGGGAGGSGYYGGGGGTGGNNSGWGARGGGGSSYIGHLNLNGTGVTFYNSDNANKWHAANEIDTDWVANIGHGGTQSATGQPGMVIITYTG